MKRTTYCCAFVVLLCALADAIAHGAWLAATLIVLPLHSTLRTVLGWNA